MDIDGTLVCSSEPIGHTRRGLVLWHVEYVLQITLQVDEYLSAYARAIVLQAQIGTY